MAHKIHCTLLLEFHNRTIIFHFLSGWQRLHSFLRRLGFGFLITSWSRSKQNSTVQQLKVRYSGLNVFLDRIKSVLIKHVFHTFVHEVSNVYQKCYMHDVVFYHKLQLIKFAPSNTTGKVLIHILNLSY